jgi:hypothetical protein
MSSPTSSAVRSIWLRVASTKTPTLRTNGGSTLAISFARAISTRLGLIA